MNERTYLEFKDADVARLQRVAALRKAGFSINDILEMSGNPQRIAAAVREQSDRLKAEVASAKQVLRVLNGLRGRKINDVDELADILIKPTARIKLPPADIRPDFARFDPETEQEKKDALESFEQQQTRLYRTGKIIVFVIATVNVVGTVVSSFINFNFFTLVVQIALSIALYMGVSWVRYFFAVSGAITAALNLYMLNIIMGESGAAAEHPAVAAFLGVYTVYAIASCIILFKSRGVSEFLYAQKNG